MKKKLLPILSVLSLIGILMSGCTQKSAESNGKDALLWKISGNGLEKPSYILGTHHLMGSEFLDSISGFNEAFESTNQVVGEISLCPDMLKSTQQQIEQAGLLGADTSYQNLMSVEDYAKFTKALNSVFTGDTINYELLKPALISSAYSRRLYSLVDTTYKVEEREPMDFYIQRLAVAKGKSLLGLESTDDQIALLFDFKDQDEQINNLLCCLENFEWNKKLLEDISTSYKEQSLTKIHELYSNSSNGSCPEYLKSQYEMDRERNRKWLEKLPDMMKEKPSFIAVGALHLAGDGGLLSELTKMGYTVEAVR